jgi:protease-4
VVAIKGEIADGADASAEWVVTALRAAFEDEGSQAVVLQINSPGGSPVQAGIINDEIRRLKEKHKKPVYAVVEESCASAAYYIAVAADEIYVDDPRTFLAAIPSCYQIVWNISIQYFLDR